MKKKFKVDYLRKNLGLPQSAIEDINLDADDYWSWGDLHRIVFEDKGKYWQTTYFSEDPEEPWSYEEEIECQEVKTKSIKIWVPIEEEENDYL